jgi:hypothetical protein
MDREELIRQRAHELWEREGRPEGRDAAHWKQACREVAGAEGGAEFRVPRDPDTGAALAADPTGWQPASLRPEPAAGKGGTGPVVAAEPGQGTAAGRRGGGPAPRARRKPQG